MRILELELEFVIQNIIREDNGMTEHFENIKIASLK